MIPKILHWIWIGPAIPWWAMANMRLFKEANPGFASQLYGEDVLLDRFRPAYDAIDHECEYCRKSDLLRISALVRFGGGWYFDCDFLPTRPLHELYYNYSDFPRGCFLTQGTPAQVANGVIGVAADSEFLSLIADRIEALSILVTPGAQLAWDGYGPWAFTQLANKRPDLVHVAPQDEFYRLQGRADSVAAYGRIAKAGYTREAVVRELGEPLPYAMHMSMMGDTEL